MFKLIVLTVLMLRNVQDMYLSYVNKAFLLFSVVILCFTDTSMTPDVEDLVLQLFELVNEKNELFRRQAELMYL
jgi:hypothetical protein